MKKVKKVKKEQLKKDQQMEKLLLKALQKRVKKASSCEILGHGIR